MKTVLAVMGLALGLLAMSGCSRKPFGDEPAPPAEAAETAFKPAAFDDVALGQLDSGMKSLVTSEQVTHVAYILSKDGVVVREGFHGTLAPGSAATVSAETPYRIYSMTKPVTAMALLMLYEEGKFSLDDPVTKFLPELGALNASNGTGGTRPAARAPTMRELFLHTAGFGYGYGQAHPIHQAFDAQGVLASASSTQMIERVAPIPLLFDPGTDWSYSIASDLQGVIIERISGQSLGDFLKARLFDPLGMKSTGFVVPDATLTALPAVTSRKGPLGPLIVTDTGDARYTAAGVGFHHGGDGLISTLSDYRKFADLLAHRGTLGGKTYLKPETFKLITTNGVPLASIDPGGPPSRLPYGGGYAFSIGTVEDVRSFGGLAPNGTLYWSGRLGTWFWADPVNKISFVGMIQTETPLKKDAFKQSSILVYRALTLDAMLEAGGKNAEEK